MEDIDVHKVNLRTRHFVSQVLGVIENMSHYVCPKCNHKEFIFGENGGKTIAEEMNLEILGITVSTIDLFF